LAGPTPEEQEQGITTAIPEGTRLLSMTYKRHGADETVNLTGLPPRDTTDFMRTARLITQIARTLIGVSGIERIWLEADGEPWGLTLRDGSVSAGHFDYGALQAGSSAQAAREQKPSCAITSSPSRSPATIPPAFQLSSRAGGDQRTPHES
jgi:Sporulation and spore germination